MKEELREKFKTVQRPEFRTDARGTDPDIVAQSGIETETVRDRRHIQTARRHKESSHMLRNVSFMIFFFTISTAAVWGQGYAVSNARATVIGITNRGVQVHVMDSDVVGRNPIEMTTANAAVTNRDGKPFVGQLRPGDEITICEAAFTKGVLETRRLRVDRSISGNRPTSCEGRLEAVFPDGTGLVGGLRVRLAGGCKAEVKDIEPKHPTSLAEIPIGSKIKGSGASRDGVLEITTAKIDAYKRGKLHRQILAECRNGFLQRNWSGNSFAGGQVTIVGGKYDLVPSLEAQTTLNEIGMRLVPDGFRELPPNDPAYIDFRFYLVRGEIPNAVAMPDGAIYLTEGMVNLAQDDSELAALLAREVSRVIGDHYVRTRQTQEKLKWLDAGIGIASRQFGLGGGGMASLPKWNDLGKAILQEGFDASLEREAERMSVAYMTQANFNPAGALTIRRKMAAWRDQQPVTAHSMDSAFAFAPASIRAQVQAFEAFLPILPATSSPRVNRVLARILKALATPAGIPAR